MKVAQFSQRLATFTFSLRFSVVQGLRPCTAERNSKPGGQEQEMGKPEHQHMPLDKRQGGQQVGHTHKTQQPLK